MDGAMTIFLRRMRAHAVMEGQDPAPWSNDDDYAVIEGKTIGRIYRDRVPGGETKWRTIWKAPSPVLGLWFPLGLRNRKR
jgi:hypothetical protein